MKKQLTIVMALAVFLCLSACGQAPSSTVEPVPEQMREVVPSGRSEDNLPSTDTIPSDSEIISSAEKIENGVDGSLEEAWMEPYMNALIDHADIYDFMNLVDINGDGTPELLISTLAQSMYIHRCYSYIDDTLMEVGIPQQWMPPDLELYSLDGTDETIWLASQMSKNGPGEYIYEWYDVTFDPVSGIKLNFFWGWTKEDVSNYESNYFMYGSDGLYLNRAKTSLDALLEREAAIFADYELIASLDMYRQIEDFTINNDNRTLSIKSLDVQSLILYFHTWREYVNVIDPHYINRPSKEMQN